MTDDGNPKLVIAPYVCHIIFNQVQRWDLMDKNASGYVGLIPPRSCLVAYSLISTSSCGKTLNFSDDLPVAPGIMHILP
jgi:hypothetical protein